VSDKSDKSTTRNDGYVPMEKKGYTPTSTSKQGGYRPTTSEIPSLAPVSVPKQPSSVQPPKK
jgi:hypothetical protein